MIAPLAIVMAALVACPIGHARAQSYNAPRSPNHVLTLQQAIDRALASSPTIGVARADVAAALGTETQSHLLPNPQASAQIENFAGSGPYNGLTAAESSFGVSQLIELGGKRSARQASARAEVNAARTNGGALRLDVINSVTVAYMQTIAAEQKLALAERVEKAAQDVLMVVERRVKAARDPLFQESRAKAALATAVAARQRAQQELTASRDVLAQFLGETTLSSSLDDAALNDAQAPLPLSTYQDRMSQSPDIVRYRQLLTARKADLDLAKAGRIPDVTVNVGVRRFGDTGDTAVMAGVSIPIPIFNQNQGEIAKAGADITRVMQVRQQAMLQRSQQLSQAWAQWNAAWQEINRLKADALPEAQRAYDLALQGYRAGGFQFIDVQDTQRTYFNARSELISALLNLQSSRADVERLTASDGPTAGSGVPQ